MPGRFYRRRRPVRKVVRKRRQVRPKNYRMRKYAGAKGGFFLTRKLPLITSFASSTVGAITVNDPTGNCLTMSVTGASPGAPAGLYDVAFSMKFSLNQLQNFTDITQISDQYKLHSVKVKLTSGYQVSTTSIGNVVPWVEYIQDHDDATIPNAALMRQKMGVRSKYFGPTKTVINMGVRPRCADEIYSNSIATAYAVDRPQWINCDYPAVEHYGIKGILHNVLLNGTTNQGLLTWDISTSLSAKDLQ